MRAEFEAALDRLHAEAVGQTRYVPLPAIVDAYRDVYGVLPNGWPRR